MNSNDSACESESGPMEVLERALRTVGDDIDRVVIVISHLDGERISQFSNARSSAELVGMLVLAKDLTHELPRDRD